MEAEEFRFSDPFGGAQSDSVGKQETKGGATKKPSPEPMRAKSSQPFAPKMPSWHPRLGDVLDPRMWTEYFSEWTDMLKMK